MKKHLLLIIIGLFTYSIGQAQSIELMKKDGSEIVNDTIYKVTSDGTSLIEVPVYVKNIGSKAIDVKVKLYVKQMLSGSSATYCWNVNCYDISSLNPDAASTINAADTAKEFHCDFDPKGNYGTTEFMFTFFNKSNPNDSATVTINYEINEPTGIKSFEELAKSINTYPNPVNNLLYINYNFKAENKYTISIYDIVGKRLIDKELNINQNISSLEISDFKSGIYIWTLEINDIPVKSEKFIKK